MATTITFTNKDLMDAQRFIFEKLISFDEVAKLSSEQKEELLKILKEYANMLHVHIIRKHSVYNEEKQTKPCKEIQNHKNTEIVDYVDKDKALELCREKFKLTFGKELKTPKRQ